MDDSDYVQNTVQATVRWEEVEPFNPYEFEEVKIYQTVYMFIQKYLVSTIKLLVGLFIIANNSLLIFIIMKFKRLQTKTNYILVNFAIANSIFSMLSIIFSMIQAYFTDVMYIHRTPFAIFIMITYLFLEISFLMSLFLGIDWFITANFRNILPQYQKLYKWIIVAIYLFVIIQCFIISFFDLFSAFFGTIFTFVILFVCILTVAIFNIIKYLRKYTEESLRTVYAFYVCRVYFLMWLPLLLMLIIFAFLAAVIEDYDYRCIIVLAILTYFFEFVAFVAPIVIVFLLRRLDKVFKMSYDAILKKSVRNYLQTDSDANNDFNV